MSARTAAGHVALASGLLLLVGLVGSTPAGWPALGMAMDPSHMGTGRMGHGMMGIGDAGQTDPPIANATEIRVEAANFGFSPSEIRVPKNTALNLTLVNPAGTAVLHDLTAPALGIHIVAGAGATTTVGLAGLAEGRYVVYCSVAGHADLGMRATLIVE